MLMADLTRFSNEAAAVSDLDEKHAQIISILAALNHSFPNKSTLYYIFDVFKDIFRNWLCEDSTFINKILFILQVRVLAKLLFL